MKNLIGMVLIVLLAACNQEPSGTTGVSLHKELGGAAGGYQRACSQRQFSFPQDHAAHKAYRNEWWYVTGNIESTDGEKFGFHITFFRIANQAQANTNNAWRANSWSSDEFYMAHFAVTAEGGEIQTYERFARSAAGLAGAEPDNTNNINIWLDDWKLNTTTNNGKLTWQLQLKEKDTRLKLTLVPQKPLVLQSDAGYSQKSADPCNASYYYSYTRLQTSGTLELAGKTYQVNGHSWLDREWSSSALGDDQSGWDWFALQLDDGTDIMLYQLRKRDGNRDTHSHAVEIDQAGNAKEIPIDNINLTVTRWWQSGNGNRYPVAGEIYRKDTDQTIAYAPLVDNQELDLTIRYWEGAIELSTPQGQNIGRGYMELTGY